MSLKDESGLLMEAYRARDVDSLRAAMAEDVQSSAAPILAKILLEDWHDSHEDIVFELGLIGDPSAVKAIAKAALIPFASLEQCGSLPEFQRKCAYALARTGTIESRQALQDLASHPDPQIRRYAEEGLEHWAIPSRTKE